MIRNLFRFFLLLVVVAVVRSLLAQLFRTFAQSKTQTPSPVARSSGGELKKDPVCGTFVPVASSVKKDINGQVLHFCSIACRDKFKVA